MIESSVESAGGPAAIAAALAARWGAHSVFAGSAGADPFGDAALDDLVAAGVDTALVARHEGAQTPLSVVLAAADTASRTIITRRRPLPPLKLEAAAVRAFAPDALLFDGHEPEASAAILELLGSPDGTSDSLLPVVLDAGSPRHGVLELLPLATHVVASERCAAALVGDLSGNGVAEGIDDAEGLDRALAVLSSRAIRARALSSAGEGLVAITLGRRGVAFLAGPETAPSCLGFPALAVPALDSTAAGDVFHGALAFCLARFAASMEDGWKHLNRRGPRVPPERGIGGWSPRPAILDFLRLATAAAGLSVTRRGSLPSIPTLAEAESACRSLPADPIPGAELFARTHPVPRA